MNAAQKLATLSLGATLLLLPAHGSVLADQIKAPIVSAGTVTTTNGSLLNVGQTTIGLSRSTTHIMHTGGIPAIISFSDARIHGDLDGDRDVDLDDHAIFVACLNGPDVNTPPLRCTQEQFDLADLEVDRDVDLHDFKFFLDAVTANYPTR
ncbi:MAG: hypothetical protein IH987_07010 [Planctomycetes bacterium]|nr:hypothetical protein [Planctomycetota bacterium]